VAPTVTCAAVVKGNAYGIGAAEAVRVLGGQGCRDFFVAQYAEAAEIRPLVGDAEVYVLNGIAPGMAAQHRKLDVCPVLGSVDEIAEWAATGRGSSAKPRAVLHVDTGINRLGLTEAHLDRLLADRGLFEAVDWRYVMSHLAKADVPDDPMNREQLDRFDRVRARLAPMRASLANSAAALCGPSFHFDMVRPGIALYGGNPFAGRPNPMERVVKVETLVLQVRDVAAGATVGYGGTWTATRPSRIAILPVGYYDGLFRTLGSDAGRGGARVWIGGEYAPIAGRVSMDMITVDVTHIPPENVRRGAVAEIFGDHVSVDEVAAWSGTISYEVLTSMGTRYRRRYTAGDEKRST
jgi:alanine racemase